MKTTIENLKETATELKDRLPDIRQNFGKLADHMKQHPIPYAIAGTGLACALGYALTSATRKKGDPESALQRTQHKIGETVQSAKERISDSASSVANTAKDTLEGAKSKVSNISDSITGTVARAKEKTLSLADEKPFIVGAGVIAAGFIAGLLLPSSKRENQWFGEKRDQLLNDAKDAGRKIIDDGKSLLNQGKEAAKDAIKSADEAVREAVEETGKSVRNEINSAEEQVKEKAKKVKRATA